jgi:hypothetical protein
MIKKLLFSATMLAVAGLGAQSYYYIAYKKAGNPRNLNRENDQLSDASGGGWTRLIGQSANQVYTNKISIPFAFQFAGQAVTHLKAATSGYITFDTGASTAPVTGPFALPTANIPNRSVSVWGMNASGSNDGIFTKTFGTAGSRQFWIKFYSMSTPGDAGNSWTYASVVLEEGTNKIYIVMQNCLQSQGNYVSPKHTLGIQVDGSTAVMVKGSPNFTNETSDAIPEDNDYYEFMYGVQPAFDLAGTTTEIPGYLSRKTAYTIKGKFRNQGSTTITGLTLNYRINNEAVVSMPVSGLNLENNDESEFTHNIPWNAMTGGWYDVRIWASALNGQSDEVPANDTIRARTYMYDTAAARKVMHEVFSSSTCGPCRPGNVALQQIFDQRPGTHVILKYQCDFPGSGDPYYTTEVGTKRSFYSVNSIPATVRDGLAGVNPNGGYTAAAYDELQAKPSFASLKVNSAQLSWKGQVDFSVSFTPLENYMSGSSWRLMAAIAERTTHRNVKSNGETEFHHVMKKMVPGPNGTVLSNLQKGVEQTINLSYTFPEVYRLPNSAADRINLATETTVEDFWDLEVVVFLQNNTTKEVIQAEWMPVAFNTGLPQTDDAFGLLVYPNPARGQVNIRMQNPAAVNISVMDVNGRVVYQGAAAPSGETQINTANWAPGLYLIRVSDGTQVSTRKVMVQ